MEKNTIANIPDIPEPFRGFLGQGQGLSLPRPSAGIKMPKPKVLGDIGTMSFKDTPAEKEAQSPYSDLMFLAAILMLCDD